MKKTAPSQITISALDLPKNLSMSKLFESFCDNNWSILLDSADSPHQDAQFDILVADPIATITTTGKQSVVSHGQQAPSINSQDNPLILLQQLMDQYCPQGHVPPSDLPFLAGALGYFGYDLGRRFEHLPNNREEEYQACDMAVGIYSWSIIKDNSNQQFYLCHLAGYDAPTAEDIAAMLIPKPTHSQALCLTSPWQANMSKVEYEQKLGKIKQYLTAGDCYQINLAQRFCATYTGHEWQAYEQLRTENKAPFSAFIRLPQCVILSISPERFLSVKDKQVQTKPIKGTRPRGKTVAQDLMQQKALLSAEKDQAENLMIVDLLRNDLSKHCEAGSVQVPALFQLESFTAVHHLVSTVTATLKTNSRPLDLLQGAFPGGSITGAPKVRAMEIIDELEPNNRNIYCGSIGYIGVRGDMDTNICIRTLLCETQLETKKIYCWAGGGIVFDSVPVDEYQESLDKVAKILPILNPHHPFPPDR
jgi:para-aminobenzoate synthetase component 1